jgi:ribosomal protein L7/L12
MTTILQCSHCGAPVQAGAATCHYCRAVLVVSLGTGQTTAKTAAGFPEEALTSLRNGNKIDAIRIYREAKKCSLREAKDAVDAIEKQLGLA